MSWFRLDDQVGFHRKVLQVGNDAFGAWVRMGTQSSAELLDGFVPRSTAITIVMGDEQILDKLVAARLLEVDGDGYRIHDFLDYNPSAKQVLKLRKERSKSGSRGGKRSASKRQAIASTGAAPVASEGLKQNPTPSRPVPSPREEDPSNLIPPLKDLEGGGMPAPRRVSGGAVFDVRESYAGIVESKTGEPYALARFEHKDIEDLLQLYRGAPAQSLAWVERELTGLLDATEPGSYQRGNLGPKKLAEWIRAGRPRTRKVSLLQPPAPKGQECWTAGDGTTDGDF